MDFIVKYNPAGGGLCEVFRRARVCCSCPTLPQPATNYTKHTKEEKEMVDWLPGLITGVERVGKPAVESEQDLRMK